jgi:hypothetical protein
MRAAPIAPASSSARTNAPRRAGTLALSRRSLLLQLHPWLGLSLGALLVLIGLSGSAMIFRFEIERLCFPARMGTHSEPGPLNFDACMQAARTVNAAKTVRSVRLPVRADETFKWLTIPAGETTSARDLCVDRPVYVLRAWNPRAEEGHDELRCEFSSCAVPREGRSRHTGRRSARHCRPRCDRTDSVVAQNVDMVTRASASQCPPAA